MAQGDPVRIIPHSPGIPETGSFEVRFADGQPSKYFYWDDNPGRRSITQQMGQAEALDAARTFARTHLPKT